MTVTRNHPLAFDVTNAGHLTHDGHPYPVLTLWIEQLMPVLLNNSKRSASLLEAIFAFLLKQKKRQSSPHLKKELNEGLYYCLLGLKATLIDQQYSWEKTKTYLNEHQKHFPLLLEEFI